MIGREYQNLGAHRAGSWFPPMGIADGNAAGVYSCGVWHW